MAQESGTSTRSNWSLSDLESRDLKQVIRIERGSFASPWSPGGFRLALHNPDVMALKVEKDGEVVAYLIAFRRERDLLIANIAVHEDHRGMGLGSRLIRESINRARREGLSYAVLDVRESNQIAQNLYRKLGFRVFGRRPGYYQYPHEDALVMGLKIDRPQNW